MRLTRVTGVFPPFGGVGPIPPPPPLDTTVPTLIYCVWGSEADDPEPDDCLVDEE